MSLPELRHGASSSVKDCETDAAGSQLVAATCAHVSNVNDGRRPSRPSQHDARGAGRLTLLEAALLVASTSGRPLFVECLTFWLAGRPVV
jgi:hypothetical protein